MLRPVSSSYFKSFFKKNIFKGRTEYTDSILCSFQLLERTIYQTQVENIVFLTSLSSDSAAWQLVIKFYSRYCVQSSLKVSGHMG